MSLKKILIVLMSVILLVGCSNNSTKTESKKDNVELFKKEIKDITLAEMKARNVPDEISEESIDAIINPMIEKSGILIKSKTYSEVSSAMIKNDNDVKGGTKLPLKLSAEADENSMRVFLNCLSGIDIKFTIVSIDVNKSVDKYELDLELVFYSYQNINEVNVSSNLGRVTRIETYKEKDTSIKLRNYDFIGIIRPIVSDVSAVRFGKSKDSNFQKMIYEDKNEVVTVNLELTQQGKKYYFRYYNESDKYPKDKIVEEFKPNGNEILIDILSCKRLDETDNSGINLIVTNKTDKKVNFMIHDDDSKSRVTKTIQ